MHLCPPSFPDGRQSNPSVYDCKRGKTALRSLASQRTPSNCASHLDWYKPVQWRWWWCLTLPCPKNTHTSYWYKQKETKRTETVFPNDDLLETLKAMGPKGIAQLVPKFLSSFGENVSFTKPKCFGVLVFHPRVWPCYSWLKAQGPLWMTCCSSLLSSNLATTEQNRKQIQAFSKLEKQKKRQTQRRGGWNMLKLKDAEASELTNPIGGIMVQK